MPISYQDFSKKLTCELLDLYPEQEAFTLVEWLLEFHLGLRKVGLFHFLEERELPEGIFHDLERLKTGEPIQYILGKAPFYGREFLVSTDTLIPRNETEELVHLIIKENKTQGLKLLDVGTGSGCIPVTLALEMDNPEIYAIDISEPALRIAEQNSQALRANVHFELCDILRQTPDLSGLDILVSNPPYVPESDKSHMHANVLAHEPWSALFVPNEDPLLFYRVIAQKGLHLMQPGGKLYFEIHETQGESIRKLLTELGYLRVTIFQDLNGKNRICSAVRP